MDLVFDSHPWQEAGLWEDPCIRIGWIQGLRTMLQHPKALSFFIQAGAASCRKIKHLNIFFGGGCDFYLSFLPVHISIFVSFFYPPGLTKPLLQLQTDTSLFVASAANQTLAHALLFCQSVSPPEACHNTDRETDRKHRTLLEETDQNHSVVVEDVCRYLKKSLVPKATSQFHQSQQVLKLLALLLTRAEPPLRDKLLLTVSDSLEELVTTNCSQLMLPLMDVLLAAHR